MKQVYRQLQEEYLKHVEKDGIPEWAFISKETGNPVLPAIPFVGKDYLNQPEGRRVLLYASAENLSSYSDIERLTTEEGMLRCHTDIGNGSYPYVHIQPINNGGYLVACYQIMKRLFPEDFDKDYGNDSPFDFINKIACANYGKFTVKAGINIDYARNKRKLSGSHLYCKSDIDILKPDVIIMPETMYREGGGNQRVKFFEEYFADRHITVIPIYQMNQQVFNGAINRLWNNGALRGDYKEGMLTKNEQAWHNYISGINKDSFYKLYSYLDYKRDKNWECE